MWFAVRRTASDRPKDTLSQRLLVFFSSAHILWWWRQLQCFTQISLFLFLRCVISVSDESVQRNTWQHIKKVQMSIARQVANWMCVYFLLLFIQRGFSVSSYFFRVCSYSNSASHYHYSMCTPFARFSSSCAINLVISSCHLYSFKMCIPWPSGRLSFSYANIRKKI